MTVRSPFFYTHYQESILYVYLKNDEVVDWLHYTKEKVWRECDKKTRETRLLTKEISVIDMANFSIFGGDSRFYKCLGEASKLSAIYYPQLLGKTILIIIIYISVFPMHTSIFHSFISTFSY